MSEYDMSWSEWCLTGELRWLRSDDSAALQQRWKRSRLFGSEAKDEAKWIDVPPEEEEEDQADETPSTNP